MFDSLDHSVCKTVAWRTADMLDHGQLKEALNPAAPSTSSSQKREQYSNSFVFHGVMDWAVSTRLYWGKFWIDMFKHLCNCGF